MTFGRKHKNPHLTNSLNSIDYRNNGEKLLKKCMECIKKNNVHFHK